MSKSLRSECCSPDELCHRRRAEMYDLLSTYFEGTSFERFERDLSEKDRVLLLIDDADSIRGFSTLMTVPTSSGATVFFSGDTIVAREYWGETVLFREWIRTVLDHAGANGPAYWFLITSGYRTWRLLPLFFREFYPNPNRETPAWAQSILEEAARTKFGDAYDPATGIVHLPDPARLKPGISDVTAEKLRHPMISFFVRRNPGYSDGDELACLTEVSVSNLTAAGERML